MRKKYVLISVRNEVTHIKTVEKAVTSETKRLTELTPLEVSIEQKCTTQKHGKPTNAGQIAHARQAWQFYSGKAVP